MSNDRIVNSALQRALTEEKEVHVDPIAQFYELYRDIRDTLYGKIYIARHRQTGLIVILKRFNKQLVARRVTRHGQPVAEDAMNEIKIHQAISQQKDLPPFIVRMLDLQQDPQYIHCALEYCSNGDLFSKAKEGRFSLQQARAFAKQLLVGVHWLHQRRVAHLDLSLENLFLDKDGNLKIGDFGVANVFEKVPVSVQEIGRRPGKQRYMSPEIFHLNPFNPFASDIWTCGVIIFILISGNYPYTVPSLEDDHFMRCVGGSVLSLLEEFKVAEISNDAVDLLQRMLSFEAERITMEDIVRHSWLN